MVVVDIEWIPSTIVHWVPLPFKHTLEKNWEYAINLSTIMCDYVSFVITFASSYQLNQNLGRVVTMLQLMCIYYLLHPLIWIFLRLHSSLNQPPWPISCMCNQNLITQLMQLKIYLNYTYFDYLYSFDL
jgi:hypothetical protein